jgi:hypothetical protein
MTSPAQTLGVVGSNPTRGIDVCVYVLQCVGSGLGVLPIVYKKVEISHHFSYRHQLHALAVLLPGTHWVEVTTGLDVVEENLLPC